MECPSVLAHLMYPDVLGTITASRLRGNALHYAVGVSPPVTRLNQTFKVIVVLQSLVDQNMLLRVNVRPPHTALTDHPVRVQLEKPQVSLGLRPGEVGVLSVPLMPISPTPPAQNYPVQVALRYRLQDEATAKPIRPHYGGVLPTALNISPYKQTQLRDQVHYEALTWNHSLETITLHFSVLKEAMPAIGQPPAPVYETLWSGDEMSEERALAHQAIPHATAIHATADLQAIYPILCEQLPELMQLRGVALHPGEVQLIACLMTACLSVPAQQAHDMRWFATLAQMIAHNSAQQTQPLAQLIANPLLEALLSDAVERAHHTLTAHDIPSTGGSRLLAPPASDPLTLTDLYSPLVLGAILDEYPNCPPAPSLTALQDAYTQRQRSAHPQDQAVIARFRQALAARVASSE